MRAAAPRRGVIGAVMLLVACGGDGPQVSPEPVASEVLASETSETSETSEPVATATIPAPAWRDASGDLVRPEHWLPGPARRGEPPRDATARLAADQACHRCHPAATHQWATSQHAGSWRSPEFQRALTAEPRAFCQRCHAPEQDAATPVGEVSPAAASLGVSCVTCHVQPQPQPSPDRPLASVWAAPRPDAAELDARAPHPIARSPAFAGPQACAGCHEFPFPDDALREYPLAMQSTITEHGRSPAANRSCADCHMPRGDDGRRSHAFVGAYDPHMLAQALDIQATRPDPTTVRVRLAPGQVGHAVPTGDLLRRLLVEISIDGPDGRPAFSARRFLGRRFRPIHQANGITLRGQLRDDRVGAGDHGGAQERTFELPSVHADHPVRWRIVHQRVAQHSRDPRAAVIDGELELASGVLD